MDLVLLTRLKPVETDNHASTLKPGIRDQVENRIIEEISDSNDVVVDSKPRIISALVAVPKPDKDIRLVHDFSLPAEGSVNDYASKDPCRYQSIHDVIDTLNPGWYMAKVDLKWAYRSVGIQESHQAHTGLKWTFRGDQQPTYMVDHRLSFGGRKSPAIFNRITQSMCRMLTRRGVPCTAYLDDFFLCGPDFYSCQTALNMLVHTLRQLGFRINWNKVVDPTQRLVFLVIQLDTVSNTMCLDPPK